MSGKLARAVVVCGLLGLNWMWIYASREGAASTSKRGREAALVPSGISEGQSRLTSAATRAYVPYGQEFWRARSHTAGSNQLDVANVIERVSHAFESDRITANSYTAILKDRGVSLTPKDERSSEALLQTVKISRGGESALDASGKWSVHGNTAQRLVNAVHGLVEHYEARQEGLELTWVLGECVPGLGPLRLEVQIDGLAYHSTTASGHHFADGQGVARMRIGPVTLVDGAGRRSEGRSEVRDNILLVEVSEDILNRAQYPLAIDPLISPEFGIDEPVPGLAGGNQLDPAVACNGRDYLVVWENPSPNGAQSDIRGTRVRSSDGLVLDVGGLPISTAAQNQRDPVVASDGTDYFVAWADDRSFTQTADIYGTKVTSDGRVVAPNGVAVCNLSGSQQEPGIACNGSNYLVVWTDGRVMGTFVGRDGEVIRPNVLIATGPPTKYAPSVASDGQGYLAVWHQASATQEDIHGARVSSAGEILDPAGFPISTAASRQSYPSVAGNSGGYLVVWLDRRSTAQYDIFGARVAPTGQVLDPDGIGIYPGSGDQFQPAVTAAAGEFHIVYTEQSASLYLARVNSEGYLLDFDPILLATGRTWHDKPALASNNEQTFVVWGSTPPGLPSQTDIVGLRLYLDGAPYDPRGFPLSVGLNAQNAPAVAANGQNFLVVWQDGRGQSPWDIYGARAAADGTILDVQALAISTATREQEFPSVASNGRDYLVIWRDSRDLETRGYDFYGSRVTGEGVVLDTNGLPLVASSAWERDAAIAGNESGYVLVWQSDVCCSAPLLGAHVSNEGVRAEPVRLDAWGTRPAIASNGRDFLAVWQAGAQFPDYVYKVYGVRFSSSGALMDPTPLPINTLHYNHLTPTVASDGRNYLVAWEASDIYGAFVSSDGVAAGAFPIFRDGNPLQSTPDIVFDGRDYLVLWEDQRDANRSGTDIYGAKVTTGGLVFPNGGFAVNASAGNQSRPAAAALDGNVLAVYQTPTGVELDVVRLTANLITRGLPPPWQSQDIGATTLPGDADAVEGSFLVRGSGAGAGESADAFHFVFQPLSGRVQIQARLARTESGFAGVVIRESLEPGAKHAFLGISSNQLVFGWRATGEGSTQIQSLPGVWPVWLRLLRVDNTVLALQSYDGSQWYHVGSSITLDLPNDVVVGLAVGSSNDAQLNTASFEEVAVFPSGVSTDYDSDGVPDAIDLCPGTPLAAIPDITGCSVTQLCPCESMNVQEQYVACIEAHATAFYRAGLITHAQQRALIEQASSTECPPLFGDKRGIAYGLLHTSLGSGILEFDRECLCGLRVESPGTGGDPFGVSVFLGEADSGVFLYPTAGEWGNYNPEWFLIGQAYGRINGAGQDAIIASVRVTKPDYEVYPVDVDLSPLEPQSLTFQVLSNDTVLAEATTAGAMGRIIVRSAPLVVPRGNPFWRMSDGIVGVLIEFTDTTEIFDEDPWPHFGVSGPFGNGIRGNRVFIRANQLAKRALYCSRVDILANIPFSIDDERLGMFRHAHKAFGPVLFDTTGGQLTIGRYGQNQETIGTIIETAGMHFEADFKPLGLEFPNSAFQIMGGTVISAALTHRDGKLLLEGGYAGEVKVFRNGMLVGTSVYTNDVAAGSLSLKNNHMPEIVGCTIVIESNDVPSLSISFKQVVEFAPPQGASLRGNSVRITPANSECATELSRVAFQLTGMASFTITGERSGLLPPALRIASSDKNVVLTWPDNTRMFSLEAAPSLNGPFNRLTNEVEFLDNRNVLTLPVDSATRFFQLNSPQ